ncbi:hypothetical protein ES708_23700 [subsurface metagenome]
MIYVSKVLIILFNNHLKKEQELIKTGNIEPSQIYSEFDNFREKLVDELSDSEENMIKLTDPYYVARLMVGDIHCGNVVPIGDCVFSRPNREEVPDILWNNVKHVYYVDLSNTRMWDIRPTKATSISDENLK